MWVIRGRYCDAQGFTAINGLRGGVFTLCCSLPIPCRRVRQIDVFSFGVLLAQLITGEYPRLDTRKEQVSFRVVGCAP